MTYQQTIDYLFHHLPMYSRIGAAAFKKDLTNTIQLCEALGNPHTKFKSIHVAGTNGKGSTSHMLAAILQTAGYKTGLYTSPHLKDFRERIKVNGKMVSESFVIDFTERIKPLIESIEPSFFEITVAMAFEYFAEQQVDVAVVEVGLGGRLDSTNIITPELSVITNIGWDHMNMLGDTLEKIAGEKAGIIKPYIPVVIGETTKETKDVFIAKARECNAPISFADQKRMAADWKYEHNLLNVEVATKGKEDHQHYQLDLSGEYQTKNLLTALEAVSQLRLKGWNIDEVVIKKASSQTKKINGLHGRWEIIHQHPTIVLDVGHNADGIKQIVRQLENIDAPYVHIILGMVKDKDVNAVLELLPKEASYYFTKAQIPRALPEEELMQKASNAELKGETYTEVNIALKAAMAKAKKEDLILVCGSVFLVGEVEISFGR
ncbi:MAG: bifunctional folylpolyglutamate synthase/dihydrofolate synthase [Sphingobacteriales bacterium]|nr:MAG: bifunctional folylpolyglutamate synthase/dihydrofolate synthase [Sphingobacteriales bacterium]